MRVRPPPHMGPNADVIVSAMLALAVVSCGPFTQSVGPSHNAATSPLASPTAVLRPPSTVLQATVAAWQLPAPLSRMVVLANEGRLLIIGGLNSAGASARSILAADPTKGVVTSDGTLGLPVHDSSGALLSGAAYIFGGGNSASISTVQVIKPGHSAQTTGNLPTARSDLAAAVAGSEAVIVGGYDGTSPANAVLATSDGAHFRVVGMLRSPVRYAAVAVMGSYLYVFGGEWAGQLSTAIQRVDLGTGGVDVVGQLPVGLGHAAALVLNDQIWLVGGLESEGPSDAVFRFDAQSGSVARAGTLPKPVSDAGIAVLDGTGYLVGGEVAGSPISNVVELKAMN
jgi:N-acetylneuraminic acid mutarotase